MDKINLKDYLSQQKYDKYYQDIEVINFSGYSCSIASWQNICNLNVDWTGKIVCDLGCFHLYFSIKALKAGAKKVYGLDNHEGVLKTAKIIAELSDANVNLVKWEGGETTPECDIALILNMLHHCQDQDITLANINCEYGVFEVYESQIEAVEKYFNILQNTPSSRSQRIILYGQRFR